VSHPKRDDPFSDLYGDFPDRFRGDRWQPDVDVCEAEDEVIVRVELAGVRQGDLRVSVDGDELLIRGVRDTSRGASVRRLHQVEIASGPFERSVQIPIPFHRERVVARLSEGLLTVTLAKRVPSRRRVEVEGGESPQQ
jgi:HSP20 family protein